MRNVWESAQVLNPPHAFLAVLTISVLFYFLFIFIFFQVSLLIISSSPGLNIIVQKDDSSIHWINSERFELARFKLSGVNCR